MPKPEGVISYDDTSPLPKKEAGEAVSRSAPAASGGKTSPRSNGAANLRTKQQTLMGSRSAQKGKLKASQPAGVDTFSDHAT